MFSSGSSSFRICLRCQARLSLSHHRRRAQGATPLQIFRSNSSEPADEEFRGQRDGRYLYPLGKLRRMRGRSLRESTTGLETLSLGEPSNVVVLREEQHDPRSQRAPPTGNDENDDSAVTANQLLESAYAERGLLGEVEVNANIDELRPFVQDDVLPDAKFQKLEEQLYEGFTRWQLIQYAEDYPTHRGSRRDKSERDLSHSTPFVQSRWTRGITSFSESTSSSSMSSSEKTKRKAIMRIMRGHWNLMTAQDSQGPGELEIFVLPQVMSLLLIEGRGLLKSLAEKRNVKIDVSKSRNLIRITADKIMAETAAQDLRRIANTRGRLKIDLKPILELSDIRDGERGAMDVAKSPPRIPAKDTALNNNEINSKLLRSIERVTGTVLERLAEQNLAIHFLGPDQSQADDAKRLLLSSFPNKFETQRQLLDDLAPGESGKIPILHGLSKGLTLRDHDKSWCRLWSDGRVGRLSDLSKKDRGMNEFGHDSRDEIHPTVIKGLVEHHINFFSGQLEEREQDPMSPDIPSSVPVKRVPFPALPRWDAETKWSTYATFGHILHEPSKGESATSNPSQLNLLPQTPRAFSFTAPRILDAIAQLPGNSGIASEYLMINLRPSPWSALGLTLISSAPPVKIVLSLNRQSKKPSIQSVQAILAERSSDIMMPQLSTDMRLTTLSTLRLQQPTFDPEIEDFIGRSYLDINGRGRLRTPETVKLLLPQRCFDFNGGKSASTADSREYEELVELEYYFTSLEYRQSVPFEIDGWRAQYANIEGGRTGGGRRGELRMVMNRKTGHEEYDTQETYSSVEDETAQSERDGHDEIPTTTPEHEPQSDMQLPHTGVAINEPANPIMDQEDTMRKFLANALKFADSIDKPQDGPTNFPTMMSLRPGKQKNEAADGAEATA
ncbi:MAG: hypothetical protein M1837_004043 [Sclerophora amabilis]|nr:MAG: hypothetical protein M1837_004043 [Sclerophora amabilis]